MSSPLQFYRTFRSLLADNGIRAVLTSGMACVEYGLQQTTKDTDWIVDCADLGCLVDLFCRLEPGLSGKNWRVSYRPLFGAPLLAEYLAAGWTSHLAIHDEPGSPEHHLDFFGQPPRIPAEAAFQNARGGIADPMVVAQMKKTDRDKDWPMVEALSQQAAHRQDPRALLHSRDPELLPRLWENLPADTRQSLAHERPLLGKLDKITPALLRRCLAIERALWEEVNRLRYRRFQHEWKEFLRRWRAHDDFAWPVALPFARQHRLVVEAVRQFALPHDPLQGKTGRLEILESAKTGVSEIFDPVRSLVDELTPPLAQMLP